MRSRRHFKQPKTFQFSRNEELYVSKEVKENALASQGKSYRPETIPAKNSLCLSRPLSLKQAAKVTFAQLKRRTLQSIIYPPEQNSLEQAAFGKR